VRLTGVLHRVQAGRPGGRPVLQAELGSAAGPVMLVWLGRDRIPGIEPGRVLAVEGTLSMQRGRPTIFNPRYDLAAGEPAHDLTSQQEAAHHVRTVAAGTAGGGAPAGSPPRGPRAPAR
jgi:hypothetical protein